MALSVIVVQSIVILALGPGTCGPDIRRRISCGHTSFSHANMNIPAWLDRMPISSCRFSACLPASR
jgi:hypothetical protein